VSARQDKAAGLLDGRLDYDLPMSLGNGAYAEVDDAAADVFEHAACNPLPDLDEDSGVAPAKGDQSRGYNMVRNRHQAGYHELTPQPTVQVADRLSLLHKLAQQALCNWNELPPRCSLGDPTRRPREENGPEFILCLLDHPAETRLGYAQLGCGSDEFAVACQGNDGA
jgi:hypothetical protein